MALEHNVTADGDRFFLGEDKVVPGIIYQKDGTTRQDITGWTMRWTLEKSPQPSSAPLMQKTTSDPPENGLVLSNPAQGEYELHFVDTDTDVAVTTLKPLTVYHHSVKRVDDNTENILTFGTWEFAGTTQR